MMQTFCASLQSEYGCIREMLFVRLPLLQKFIQYVCAHVTCIQHMWLLTSFGGYASMHSNYFMLSAREGFN